MAKEFVTKEEFAELLKFVHKLAEHSLEVAKTAGCNYQKTEFATITKQLAKMIKKYK